MIRSLGAVAFGVCLATSLLGCGDDAESMMESDAGVDAGPGDAGADGGGLDSGTDAGPLDAGVDGGPLDAGFDAGVDAGPVDPFLAVRPGPMTIPDGQVRISVLRGDGLDIAFDSVATNLDPADDDDGIDVYVRNGSTGAIHLLSKSPEGVRGDGSSSAPTMSRDGRWVAFASAAGNLIEEDSNGVYDIFVADRDADGDGVFDEEGDHTIVRVSESSAGAQFDVRSAIAVISETGRFVVFLSAASTAGVAPPGTTQVYVRDRDTDEDGIFDEAGAVSTSRVSFDHIDGGPIDGGDTRLTIQGNAISTDGRHVAFISDSSDILAGDDNGLRDIFVVDRDTDEDGIFDEPEARHVAMASRAADGSFAAGDAGHSGQFVLSRDGRHIAFGSDATNLVAGDDNGFGDLFLVDRDADGDGSFDEAEDHTILRPLAGSAPDGMQADPEMSADARFIVFESLASNLVAGDANDVFDVFVVDRDADENGVFDEGFAVARVSQNLDGSEGTAFSANPTISADGRWVVYETQATELTGETHDHSLAMQARNPLYAF